ncbi:antibiotic biosynthesis monooxygenase [Streptomyces hygroscopicus]|uniref:antibiotic biosynthesis monooxygenase n=1 Tax=Streptomyces hygroscopicus TaxID=1912 RepID=UPI000830FB0A|nr:antibiotic biosynthesis monooxygenase [Streptomyces hygroscopicus]GLV78767.1 antibiotic biosynthesis monooxygenase [Streptomyces hygroscopicus subsp. hygroscopicus]
MSVLTIPGPLPDAARPDVGAALFSTWSVGTPERQRAAVEAIAATWDSRPWPAPELLSYTVYAGTDGDTLMHHSQWADEAAYHVFFRTRRQERNDAIDSAVPDIKRLGLSSYQRYRSFTAPAAQADGADPGLFVVAETDFDDADPRLRRNWVDLVVEALESEPDPGLLSADFHLIVDGERHLSTDRARVLSYARWTGAEAYEAAMAAEGPRAGSSAWGRVRAFPGLVGSASRRYHFRRSFVPASTSAPEFTNSPAGTAE